MSQAGQPSERTPDFIPGWFKPRSGNPDTAEREAVKFIGTQDFPINFLRLSEMVFLPPPPQLGVCVGERDSSIGMCLAVPPGYWMVRDADGRPQLWSEEDFAAKWVRNNDREWIAPVERAAAVGAEAMERGAEALTTGIVDVELTDDQRDQLRYVEGWQGTPPAEGTRRKLIAKAIYDVRLEAMGAPGSEAFALVLADAVEEALIGMEGVPIKHPTLTQIDAELAQARADLAECFRLTGADPDGAGDPMLAREALDEVRRFRKEYDELEEQVAVKQATIDGLAATVSAQADSLEERVAKLAKRSDAWVTELAYQAAGAATRPLMEDHPDYVFPAERCQEAVAYLLETYFDIPRACKGCADEEIEHGAKEVDGRRDDTIKSLTLRCDSLLAQRESARLGEDQFKAQRDAALHLLRWLIGDLIPSHLVDLSDEENESGSGR